MPIADDIAVLDADAHLTEVPDLWEKRLPAKYLEAGPRVVHTKGGRDVWLLGGKAIQGFGATSVAGWHEHWPAYPPTKELVDAATYDPYKRAERLDEYQIAAQVLFPNILAFSIRDLLAAGDDDFRLACVQAYNDYIAEFAATVPGRFLAIGVVPFWNLDHSVAEIERCAELGHNGLLFPNQPEAVQFPNITERHWDPIFGAAQAADLSLNFHIGFGGFDSSMGTALPTKAEREAVDEREAVGAFRANITRITTLGLMSNARAIVDVLTAGICHRFPTLKFVSVESGFGYIPYLLEALDWQWLNNGAGDAFPERMMPSDYFRRQMYATFWFEGGRGLAGRVDDFQDNVMFESDFPHPTCLAPGPVSYSDAPNVIIERNLAEVDPSVRRKILSENAARVYHVDLATLSK